MNTRQAVENSEKIKYLKDLKRFKKSLDTEPLTQETVSRIEYHPPSRLEIRYTKKKDQDKIFPYTTINLSDLLEAFSVEMTPKLIELISEVVNSQIAKTETELDNLK